MLNELLHLWSTEKITSLAPDQASVKAARKITLPQQWHHLGHDTYSVWGEYKGSAATPYQVKLDLLKLRKEEIAVACTCPSRKQPCKHALALLYIMLEQTDAIPQQATAPDYVQAWLDKQAVRARQQQEKKKQSPSRSPEEAAASAAKTIEARKIKIAAGLQELERWLENLIRHGLGDPQIRSYAFWDAKAARMIDAQAPGIARLLQEIAGIPSRTTDWIEPMLTELGKLYLVTQSFKQFDQLPIGSQLDLRTVLGWNIKRHELDMLDMTEGVLDHWVVIGQYVDRTEDQLRRQKIWLRGQTTGRDALILEFAFGDTPFDTFLQSGTAIDGELAFYPGQYPLRAFILRQNDHPQSAKPLVGSSIQAAIEAYAAALACNPWLPQFPFLLEAVIPTRYGGQWVISDEVGHYLPLASQFQHKWSLLAMGGGHPIQLAGEWDGNVFLPTGAVLAERFVDFNEVGKI